MTDQEKLDRIKGICEEACNNEITDSKAAILHKAQALCNIYALFLYDGATIPQIEDKKQVCIDDLIGR